MRLLLLGCTGFIGHALRLQLRAAGHSVTVVSRSHQGVIPREESWIDFHEDWMAKLAYVDAVVNLAGEPLAQGLLDSRRRKAIMDSRAGLLRLVVDRLSRMESRPSVWVNASAVGYYGDRGEEWLEEAAAPGKGFLASVCEAWESEAMRLQPLGLREVRLRFGVVLGMGGVLAQLSPLYRLGLGGPIGSGGQWMPWVHVEDAVSAIMHALENPSMQGACNVVAPDAKTQGQFAHALAAAFKHKAWLRTPAILMRILLGDLSEMMLFSQRVRPAALLASGFEFGHPELEESLRQIVLE